MTDSNPQATPQATPQSASQAEKADGRRAGRQAGSADQPQEQRSFDSNGAAAQAGAPSGAQAAKADAVNRQILGESLQIQHEAVQAGQEALKASQAAATQATALWRQSLEPLAAFQSQMRHLFEDAWRQTTGLEAARPMHTARPFAGGSIAALMGAPAADLQETDSLYHLAMEVPGLSAKDLKLGLKGDTLVIAGQKLETRRENGAAYRLSERRYGSFERAFPIPADVDRGAIAAKVESGLLTVDLPKANPTAAGGAWSPIEVRG